ncbi:protein of unknown function [Caldanaerobius fijiensis DSM 17918]|uniref:Galactose mutarotase n=1 Tax=Caldanaerobius fijiensis DSM 17918 TaxID=1121256 RepID=A0A1M4UW88_9THEO|nr:aldose 1-epimerase family protein [Caldanaerobius fijiensis]SHE60955.1 protein of unknown function [Caldanaerobius fijiensis DSM 17918]
MKIFGEELSAQELKKYFGDMSQIADIRRCIISEGRATGTDIFDVKTGSGLVYTVLPNRGMDIADASYKGVPLSFISKTGIVSSQYYASESTGFLRNFFGGLLTTCGLMNAGPQCEVDGEMHRMHGRISNTPAYQVGYQCSWVGDEYELMMQGTVKESRLFGENLTLKRTIVSRLGQSVIKIHDVITNEGFDDTPFMLLYHMNLGYPVVSRHSLFIVPSRNVVARDEEAKKGIDDWERMQDPTHGYREQVFFHDLASDADGNTLYGVINEKLSMGVYFRINKNQLPCFTQWKMMGEQDYTLGLEPGVNIPEGRLAAHNNGHLKVLKPQEEYVVDIEFGVIEGPDAIEDFKHRVKSLMK